ncbi:hypothetical protein J7E36_16415 [Pseudomonas fluorescens]|nr:MULTISPECIES: hypothetical protein [Pseudomonas]MBT2340731.1 hypothetical protein [Pseudomonas fluorescens]MCD4529128.1 hypothetical protein [Pseudomonas sp. C3-2018]
MTGGGFWKSWLAFWLMAGPLLLSFAGAIFSLYLSRRHLDSMKKALKNSRYIYLWGPSLGKRGLVWSLLEIAKIAGMVVWPKAYIRLGDVDPVDVENFPSDLKRLLIVKVTMTVITAIWMIIAVVLIKLR